MGFLRRYAQRVDFKERKRAAMTTYYKESATLLFMKSKEGKGLHTEADVLNQEALVDRLKFQLQDQFEVTV